MLALAPLLALLASGAPAEAPASGRSHMLVRLIDCRTLASAEEKLACYEREVAAIDAAEASGQLRVVDRQQLRRARRSLFGLNLPNLDVFRTNDDDKEDEEDFTRLTAKIRVASRGPSGKWTFDLEDGARWAQIDSRELPIDPRAGQEIVIRRAAMGSFFANVNKQIAIRVSRVR